MAGSDFSRPCIIGYGSPGGQDAPAPVPLPADAGAYHIVCQGVQRMRILDFLPGTPVLAARVLQLPEPEARGPEIEARFLHLQSQAVEALQLLPQAPQDRKSTRLN